MLALAVPALSLARPGPDTVLADTVATIVRAHVHAGNDRAQEAGAGKVSTSSAATKIKKKKKKVPLVVDAGRD